VVAADGRSPAGGLDRNPAALAAGRTRRARGALEVGVGTVQQDPSQIKLSTLAAVCTVLECTPNDLFEVDTPGRAAASLASRCRRNRRSPGPADGDAVAVSSASRRPGRRGDRVAGLRGPRRAGRVLGPAAFLPLLAAHAGGRDEDALSRIRQGPRPRSRHLVMRALLADLRQLRASAAVQEQHPVPRLPPTGEAVRCAPSRRWLLALISVGGSWSRRHGPVLSTSFGILEGDQNQAGLGGSWCWAWGPAARFEAFSHTAR